MRKYGLALYARAENTLFLPSVSFSSNHVLHTSAYNQELTVDELFKISKCSIAFAEMMQADDLELASASITVFQGIEVSLNNHQQISRKETSHSKWIPYYSHKESSER